MSEGRVISMQEFKALRRHFAPALEPTATPAVQLVPGLPVLARRSGWLRPRPATVVRVMTKAPFMVVVRWEDGSTDYLPEGRVRPLERPEAAV